ncbi:MAG: Ig-like domain-containing protein [Thermoplasmatota archaeon]
MKAATFVFSLLLLFSFLQVSPGEAAPSAGSVVVCEVATASWCQGCPNTGAALEQLHGSDSDFYYIMMVTDKNDVAADRIDDYNPVVYPTSFFDGGYEVVAGGTSAVSPYRSSVQASRARARADVDLSLDVQWDDGDVVVGVNVRSDATWEGTVRAYVVEPDSRWSDYDGESYRYAFLDFAIERSVTVDGTMYLDGRWNPGQAGYADVTRDNVMVVAALFNAEGHTAYSDPPDNTRQFTAHYVDAAAAARPAADSPPDVTLTDTPARVIGVRYASFTWTASDVETPADEISFSYRLLGLSETWSSWSQVRRHGYDGLPDGTYTFEVRARDDAGQVATASYRFTVDTSPPVVTATRPSDDAVGVDAFASVRVTFSHPMNQTGAGELVAVSPAVAVSRSWQDARHLVIEPRDRWAYDTAYTVTLSTRLQRTSGQHLARPYRFSFQTASADTEPPAVVETYPGQGGSMPVNGSIHIRFSEGMETRYFVRALDLQPWFAHHLEWRDNDSLLAVVPELLQPGVYTVSVNTYAMDRHGNRLPERYTLSFTVVRPRLVSSWPVDGARKVPVDTAVSLRFSEAMDQASVEAALSAGFSYTAAWNGTAVTLHPVGNLSYSTGYVVRLDENATNRYGVGLEDSYVVSFSTTEPPRPGRIEDGRDIPAFTLGVLLCAVAVMLLLRRRSR